MNAADDFCAAPDKDIITNDGSTLMLAAVEGVRAYSYLMENCAASADFCAFRDEDAMYSMRKGRQFSDRVINGDCAVKFRQVSRIKKGVKTF